MNAHKSILNIVVVNVEPSLDTLHTTGLTIILNRIIVSVMFFNVKA